MSNVSFTDDLLNLLAQDQSTEISEGVSKTEEGGLYDSNSCDLCMYEAV